MKIGKMPSNVIDARNTRKPGERLEVVSGFQEEWVLPTP